MYEDEIDASILASRQLKLEQEGAGRWQPSQVLGYEDPEAMAVREKLMRGRGMGMDGPVEEQGMRRVERIGSVVDAGGEGAGRRRGRRR